MGKIYLITGNDEHAIKNKAREIIASLCGTEPESNPCLEIVHGDSTEFKPAELLKQIIQSSATPAFLGSAKTIWFKNFDFKPLDDLDDDDNFWKIMDNFIELIKNGMPDDTSLVMSIFSLDKRSAFYKACQKTAEITIFDKVDVMSRDWNERIRSVIYDSCRKNGVRMTEDAVAFVSETAGVDVGRVQSEIDKLTAYALPNNSISLADCKKVCSRTPELAGWSFSNALSEKNLAEAVDALNTLVNMETKSPEIKIIHSVMYHFQDLIKIKAVCRKLGIRDSAEQGEFTSKLHNVPPAVKLEIKDESIFKMHPFRAWKVFSSAVRFTDHELAIVLSDILRVNKSLVSGAVSPRMELEALAVRICTKKR